MPRNKAVRPRDSETSKAAILAAARDRFAAEGYDRATIRSIAADAGLDPALVMRYFGNKEKLFAAAADFDLRLPDLSGVPRAQVGAALVDHFLERWEADDTFMALLRAAATNEAAAERARAVLANQVAPVVATLANDRIHGAKRAGLVASQILGLALCRYVLQLPPVVGMSRAEIVSWVGPTVQRYITAPRDVAGGA